MKGQITMSLEELDRLKVLEQVTQKMLKQIQAADLLHLTDRHIRRLAKTYRQNGAIGLIHGLRGKSGNHKLPPGLKEKAINIVKEKYHDFTPAFASEQLAKRDGLKINDETLRLEMIKEGLWLPKKRKTKHRAWRERKECLGQMVQFDGSHHDWFEGRGQKCVLLCSRDDATNQTEALFAPSEDTLSVFRFWKSYFQKHGKPKSVYLDRHSIYKTTRPVQGQGEDFDLTQFERAMAELNIEVIHAYSAQAKGRVENVFSTLQDRLVKELRLEGINDIRLANQYLETKFMIEFNQRFSLPAKLSANFHRSLNEETNLDKILAIRKLRQINSDFTLRFENRWFQLNEVQPTLILPGQKVVIEQRLDQTIRILLGNHYLGYRICDKRPINERRIYALTSQPQPRVWLKPKANHPWRKFVIQKQKQDISKLVKTGHF